MPTGSRAPLTHTPAKPTALEHRQQQEIRLGDMVQVLVGRFWLILAVSLLGATLACGLVYLRVPVKYTTSSTLVILPSRFASDLRPEVLTVQGYMNLLESDAVVSKVEALLREKGQLAAGQQLKTGQNISSEIFVSSRDEGKSLASLLVLRGSSGSPDTAAAIVNTWAEVFIQETGGLVARSVDPVIDLIKEQHAAALDQLTVLQDDRYQRTVEFQERMSKLDERWKRRLLSFDGETLDRQAAHQVETRTSFAASLAEFEEGADYRAAIGSPLQQLVTLRMLMAQTPELLVLDKSLDDEVLWEALLERARVDSPLFDAHLESEEVNPVFQELVQAVSDAESAVFAAAADEPKTTRARIASSTAGLESLQRRRGAGLSKLHESRLAERQLLVRSYRKEQALLRTEWRLQATDLDDRLVTHRQFISRLARKNLQADLATAERGIQDIVLGTPAVSPDGADPRPFVFAAAAGFVLALLAGLLWAVLPLLLAGARAGTPAAVGSGP